MSQPLPYDEISYDRNVKLEGILSTPDDSEIGYLIGVDLSYRDYIKEETRNLTFAPENEVLILKNLHHI